MALILHCSCGWTKNHDEIGSKSAMSEILNRMHENTVKDHKVVIEEA